VVKPAQNSGLPRIYQQLRDFPLYLPNPGFRNPAWNAAGLRVLIARLSPFADVQRSTPHLFLFREVRSALPDAFIDMSFLPSRHDAARLEEAGLPLLLGTQSRRGAADFNVVFVSNSWLLEQVNLPFLILHSGIPLWSSQRDDTWPAFILGGSNASGAHALVAESGDSIPDALFFGEAEGRVGKIVQLWKDLSPMPKHQRVARIASEVEGLWPSGSLGFAVKKARAPADAPAAAWSGAPILPGPEASTARLSITRGCPCLCSFCFEGFDRAPFREIGAAQLLQSARELKIATGADTLEVDSFNFNTHSELAPLLEGLHLLFHRVNLMSQRVDILARNPDLLDLEIAADKRSFAFGIEGVSGRMRRFLHKSLEERDIRAALHLLHAKRIREIKLFYLLTGRETGNDFEEFSVFMKWLKQVRQRAEAAPRIVFSFGRLVRMPFTPLRYDPPLLDPQAWRAPAGRAKSICETNGFEFRLAMDWPEYSATQALALGGHDLHPLLLQLAEAGQVDAAGLTPAAAHAVAHWVESSGGAITGGTSIEHAFGFPFLDDKETRAFLHGRYEKSIAERDDGYCRRGEASAHACASCPGCTRNPRRATSRSIAEAPAARALAGLVSRKHRLKAVIARARLPRETAGMGARWAGAWLLREILQTHPGQADNILAVTEALVDESGVMGADAPWFGETLVSITAWNMAALEEVLSDPTGPLTAWTSEAGPHAVRSLSVRLDLPADLFPEPVARLAQLLRDKHAPVTLTRSGGVERFVVSEKSKKKQMLRAGTCLKVGAGHRLDLVLGRKPFLGDFLETFGGAAHGALAEITEIV
jgi:hypothetical protein